MRIALKTTVLGAFIGLGAHTITAVFAYAADLHGNLAGLAYAQVSVGMALYGVASIFGSQDSDSRAV